MRISAPNLNIFVFSARIGVSRTALGGRISVSRIALGGRIGVSRTVLGGRIGVSRIVLGGRARRKRRPHKVYKAVAQGDRITRCRFKRLPVSKR